MNTIVIMCLSYCIQRLKCAKNTYLLLCESNVHNNKNLCEEFQQQQNLRKIITTILIMCFWRQYDAIHEHLTLKAAPCRRHLPRLIEALHGNNAPAISWQWGENRWRTCTGVAIATKCWSARCHSEARARAERGAGGSRMSTHSSLPLSCLA